MCKHSYSDLAHLLIFASLVSSVYLASTTSWQDDSSSEEGTEKPEDENNIFKSYVY